MIISYEAMDKGIKKSMDNGYEIGFRDGWNAALKSAIDLLNKKSISESSNAKSQNYHIGWSWDDSNAPIDFEDASYANQTEFAKSNKKFLEDLTRDANKYFDDLVSSGMSKDDAYGKVGIFIAHKIAGE